MKERPILFKPDLVRAILSGRKTETRRPCLIARDKHTGEWADYVHPARESGWIPWWGGLIEVTADQTARRYREGLSCPLGAAGDRLWVRETWALSAAYDSYGKELTPHCEPVEYRAGPPVLEDERGRWRPSIHMPRWACRLVLPIAEVRAERLQDITEAGAVDEGFPHEFRLSLAHRPQTRFVMAWEDIYGEQDGLRWADNPWVWVVRWSHADILTGADARPEST